MSTQPAFGQASVQPAFGQAAARPAFVPATAQSAFRQTAGQPAFGAVSTAAKSFGFEQSAVVLALGQQPATTPSFSFGQQPLQQHHHFH